MTARYPGTCTISGKAFKVGDEIVKSDTGYALEAAAREADQRRAAMRANLNALPTKQVTEYYLIFNSQRSSNSFKTEEEVAAAAEACGCTFEAVTYTRRA